MDSTEYPFSLVFVFSASVYAYHEANRIRPDKGDDFEKSDENRDENLSHWRPQ